ncbi:MAG: elongation factor G [Clostridia bacterium]|nr:elongation factor G [Clostridia bacterium]
MKAYQAQDIRNVAIAGHGGRGKTTLAEAMLYTAGAIDRMGSVADGNTAMDFDPEEKKRHISVSSATASLEWNGVKINLLDTPGFFDFAGGLSEGVRAADCVITVLAAGSDLDVGAEKAVKAADSRKLPKIFAITKCDAENTDFYKTLEAVKEKYGAAVCPVVVPHYEGGKVVSYVNFLQGKAFTYSKGKAAETAMPADDAIDSLHEAFTEAVASADEELMERYFEDLGESFTHDDIVKGMNQGVKSGEMIPVYACSSLALEGVDFLLNAIQKYAPSPAEVPETAKDDAGNDVAMKCDPAAEVAAICFKTVADPFVGKMSFFKVADGTIKTDGSFVNSRSGDAVRLGKLIVLKSGKTEDIPEITAGDIGVITKLDDFKTGDTLCSAKRVVSLDPVAFPNPCLSMAVKVRKKGEEEKVSTGLKKLSQEDPSMQSYIADETREQIISGLGEQHLDVIVSKLKSKFGVEVDLEVPRVPYRETIRKQVSKQGRHKKQSGGHGQFGDVFIRFEPIEGDDFEFAEEVVGGAVPKNFFPAVEKGLRECISRGIIAGYPMVGIKATLYDGSYHPVDSSEMAFKTAAQLAFKAAIPEAQPTILEPYGTLEAFMPSDNLGDIMSDVSKRRGRVLGMEPAEDGMQKLVAEVPMGEMGDFSTVLRSVTAGRGFYTFEFVRYEDAPKDVADKVIEESKKDEEE